MPERSLSNSKEVHWSEGMLLLPQHMQAAHRYWETVVGTVWDFGAPFSWGVDELDISEVRIRKGEVAIERCRIRMPNGTWLMVPENTEVAPRQLGDLPAKSPEGVIVYLGIPRLHEVRPNAAREVDPNSPPIRFLIEPYELNDENTGGNAREIEVRSFRGRLFFGAERSTPGYEMIELTRLYFAGDEGGIVKRDAGFIPPLLRVGASATLSRMIADVFHETGARNRELADEAARRDMSFSAGSGEQTEWLMMVHVLNQANAWFRQVTAVPELKPFPIYCELCRLAGQLSVFDPARKVMDYPIYDHRKIGEVFRVVCDHIRVLLDLIGPGAVKWRDFGPRSRGQGLQVALEEEWLAKLNEVFVGVQCANRDINDLNKLFKEIAWKIASSDDVDNVFDQGLAGLELRPVYTRRGTLPTDWNYFQVVPDEKRWASVRKSKMLALRYTSSAQDKLADIKFRVYFVLPKGKP